MNLFLSFSTVSLVAFGLMAQTPVPTETPTPTPAASDSPLAKLPYGVEDVVKLTRAQVSEDVTLNFIQNSGTIYKLAPGDIVALKNDGVSDKVINAMLDQRKSVPVDVANQNALQAQVTAAASSPPAVGADFAGAQLPPVYAQPVPVYVQPNPVYVQPEPDAVPPSTLYVIPYGPSGCTYYRYPSFYSGAGYGCGSTVVTIGAGYGGTRYYASGRHGGGHGGGVYRFGHR
jgi:uncharacterized protein YdbL (DUF1318 family)